MFWVSTEIGELLMHDRFVCREVQQSTGFGQYENAHKQDDEMPSIVQETIKANMEDFEYLKQFCLKL
jgi:hypothetical protein